MTQKFLGIRVSQSRRFFMQQSGLLASTSLLAIAGNQYVRASDEVKHSMQQANDRRPTPGGVDPTKAQRVKHLHQANQVAQRAVTLGHHPFGAILVAPDNETVLLEQGNIDSVNHAEATLARVAYTNFKPDYLWGCTLYSTAEPCVMCSGTQYWVNIGRLVYGIAESRLLELTGSNKENPTLDVPCRYLFEHSQKNIKVWGPIAEVEAEIAKPHEGFWN